MKTNDKSRFHDCPVCGAGGIIPDGDGRCTHCGASMGDKLKEQTEEKKVSDRSSAEASEPPQEVKVAGLIGELVEATSFRQSPDEEKKTQKEKAKEWREAKESLSWSLPLAFVLLTASMCAIACLIYRGVTIGGDEFWISAIGSAIIALFMSRYLMIPLAYYYSQNKDKKCVGVLEIHMSVVCLSALIILGTVVVSIGYLVAEKGLFKKVWALFDARYIGSVVGAFMLLLLIRGLKGR